MGMGEEEEAKLHTLTWPPLLSDSKFQETVKLVVDGYWYFSKYPTQYCKLEKEKLKK